MIRVCARRALVAVCVVVASTVGVDAVAFGARAHYYAGAGLGVSGSGAGGLSLIAAADSQLHSLAQAGSGVAVNELSHDVYVADTGNRRVDEFEADGSFVRGFGWGVVDGEAKLEVCTDGTGCRAGLSGSGPGEFETPVFVAVDNDPSSSSYGDVYVGDTGDNLVTKFSATGVLAESWGNNGSGKAPNGQLNGSPAEVFDQGFAIFPISGLAVGGSGLLSVFDRDALFAFDQASVFSQSCMANFSAGWGQAGMDVDAHGSLYYIDANERVLKVEPDCHVVGQITKAQESDFGVAVDRESGGDLYVDNSGSSIEGIRLAECVPYPISMGNCVADQVLGEGVLNGAAGLAVDSQSGTLYATDAGADRIVVFPVAVSASLSGASEVTAHTATLKGTVNPQGSELSGCAFEYGEGEAFDRVVACEESPSSIGSGSSTVPVQARVTDLTGGTDYRFRLRAANAHGRLRSEQGTFATTTVARIEEPASSELALEAGGGVSAVLGGRVDPMGVAGTSCRIEYGTSIAYGTSVACEPGALSGSTSVAVSGHLEGLSAGTEYHWRLLVEDANGVSEGPDQTFVYLTGPQVQTGCSNEALRGESDMNPETGTALSLALPDCRAYEMVTPPAKNGTLVNDFVFGEAPTFSRDGSRMMAVSIQCFDAALSCDPLRGEEAQPYSFERQTNGWVTTPLAPSPQGLSGDTMLLYNADSGLVLFGLPDAASGVERLDIRQPDGLLQEVGPVAERPGGIIAFIQTTEKYATSDFSKIVYQSGQGEFWPSLGAGQRQALEYVGSGNSRPVLVGVTGGTGSTSLISSCETTIGAEHDVPSYGSLSADGRVVVFTAESPCASGTGSNSGVPVPESTIYERIDQSRTVLVSGPAPEPQCDSACQSEPTAGAGFAGASEDGSRVFFTSTQKLTNQANEDHHGSDIEAGRERCFEVGATNGGCNLYEFECPNRCEDESQRRVVDVSAPMVAGETPQVQGVVASSRDGSHVYFIAKGVLTSGANPEGGEPEEGAENLYAYERDNEHPNGHLAFVTILTPTDDDLAAIKGGNADKVANVTPDGRFLLFTSHRALTPDVTRVQGPAQVYRYDAQSERLLRVSIGRQGFGDNGNAGTGDASIVQAIEGYIAAGGRGRSDPSISDDGSVVFFRSPLALTPGALDDRPIAGNPGAFAQNVYEWEQDGKGGCEQSEGCVSLISDGRDSSGGPHEDSSAVQLLGTDASGEDVFFETADQLVGADTDAQIDVYDAHVGGGFPAPTQPPACELDESSAGGSCRGASSEPGVFSTPISLSFTGPANTIVEKNVPAPGKPTGRTLTRTQKLKRALALCHKRYRSKRDRRKLIRCEQGARERYRAHSQARGSHKTRGKR